MYPHKTSLPEEIRPSFDINVLPGNLPENAIDAARQTEKKYLSVHIALNKGVMKIKIDNSFSPSDIRQEKRGDRRETKILDQVNISFPICRTIEVQQIRCFSLAAPLVALVCLPLDFSSACPAF